MTVEIVEYIGDFESHLPGELDLISEGDDHILNLKKGYKASFPNFTSALEYSNAELNTIRSYISGTANNLIWTGVKPSKYADQYLGYKQTGELVLTQDMLPLGSIVPSWFDHALFISMFRYGGGPPPPAQPSDYHFVLCDGHQITGTKLNILMAEDPYTLPDLRNCYLRQAKITESLATKKDGNLGLAGWSVTTPPVFKKELIITDKGTSVNHNHNKYWTGQISGDWDCFPSGAGTGNTWGGSGAGQTWASFSTDWAFCGDSVSVNCPDNVNTGTASHTHPFLAGTVAITTDIITNGTETRPKSLCMNYYIRVD